MFCYSASSSERGGLAGGRVHPLQRVKPQAVPRAATQEARSGSLLFNLLIRFIIN